MTYRELLESEEWQGKRQEVLKRDRFNCSNCNNSELVISSKIEEIKYIPYNESKRLNTVIFGDGETLNSVNVWGEPLDKKFIGKIVLYTSDERNKCFLVGIADNYIIYYDIYKTRKKQGASEPMPPELLTKLKEDKLPWLFSKGLHVHHKYYQVDLLPWEYPDNALTSLCHYCHENLHKDGKVDVFDEFGNNIDKYSYCKKCHGAGWFPEYKHFHAGICFRCWGAKYEELIDTSKGLTYKSSFVSID